MMGLYFLEEAMTLIRRKQKVPQIRSIKAVAKYKPEEGQKSTLVEISWVNGQLKQ
jgi:hypothetical protein